MGSNDFANPAFRITREPGVLRIHVAVKAERFRSLLNFVWLLVWAAGEVAIVLFILGVLRPPEILPPVSLLLAGLFVAAYTVAGGVVLWRWLWCVGGGESFLVAREALSARRAIWGIGHSRTFEFRKLRSVKAARLKYRVIYPTWGRMFIGHGGSKIEIECDGLTYAYGKGLREAEAGDLVALLKDEMGSQFSQQLLPRRRAAFLR